MSLAEFKSKITVHLRPCRYCGGEAELFQGYRIVSGHGEMGDSVGVRCTKCSIKCIKDNYAECEVTERLEQMIALWNKK